jgi:hypothetical protein
LSASPHINLEPDISKIELMIPDSASNEPGWAVVSSAWNRYPDFQSQKLIDPLSPPEKKTFLSFTDNVLIMALCPSKFCMKAPSGHFHCLMLPVLPVANVNSVGCVASARTPFLWWVSTPIVLPAARSHMRTVESRLPVMTCGSASWQTRSATVPVWPDSTCTLLRVRMSQTRATPSRPPVTRTSRVGWSLRV